MEPILRTTNTVDWITIVIVASVLLMVIAKNFFYNRFSNFIILPFNNKYIFMYNKKDRLLNWFHIFFTIFQVVNLSLFVYLARNILFNLENNTYLYIYLIILGGVLLFLLIKVFLQLGNGFVFSTSKTISQFIFKKLSYLNYSSIVMFLANIVLAYMIKDSKTVVYISVLLILLINVLGWVTVIRNHQKFIVNNFFYFILYLCALEIAPFVIIGSYLKD